MTDDFTDADRDLVQRLIAARRDVRTGFTAAPVPDDVLYRILRAAHRAPSVGLSQPWDFLVIRDRERRSAVQQLASGHRGEFAGGLPLGRQRQFDRLKVEAVLQAPVQRRRHV